MSPPTPAPHPSGGVALCGEGEVDEPLPEHAGADPVEQQPPLARGLVLLRGVDTVDHSQEPNNHPYTRGFTYVSDATPHSPSTLRSPDWKRLTNYVRTCQLPVNHDRMIRIAASDGKHYCKGGVGYRPT